MFHTSVENCRLPVGSSVGGRAGRWGGLVCIAHHGSGYYDFSILAGAIANGIIWTLVAGPAVGGTLFVVFAVAAAFPTPNHLTSVYIDANDNAWLAAQPKGVFMFDGKDWSQYNTNNGLPHNRIFDMLEMKDGTMWFGTKKGIAIMER